MTAFLFIFAWLLAALGHGPMPAAPTFPPVAVRAPAVVAPPAHRAPRSETHQLPAAAPTVAAPTTPPAAAAAPYTPPWEMCPEHPQMSDDPWIVANCPTS